MSKHLINITHQLKLSIIKPDALPSTLAIEVSEMERNLKLFRLTLDASGAPAQASDVNAIGQYIGGTNRDAMPLLELVEQVRINQTAAGIQPAADARQTSQTIHESTLVYDITSDQALKLHAAYQQLLNQRNQDHSR